MRRADALLSALSGRRLCLFPPRRSNRQTQTHISARLREYKFFQAPCTRRRLCFLLPLNCFLLRILLFQLRAAVKSVGPHRFHFGGNSYFFYAAVDKDAYFLNVAALYRFKLRAICYCQRGNGALFIPELNFAVYNFRRALSVLVYYRLQLGII